MGYHTSIIFMGAFRKDDPQNKDNENWTEEAQINAEIDAESEINNFSEENDPIKEVSLKHKDWIIEIEGRGGDQEDLWRRRYLNGEHEEITPSWPEYDTIVEDEVFESYVDLTDINTSMELESGQEVARLRRDNRVVTVEVRGDVRVVYKKQAYRSVSQMPRELVAMFHNGKAFKSKRVYIDMNNWFEVFTWEIKNGELVWTGDSDVVDVEGNSEQDMKNFLTDIMNDYFPK